MGCGRMSEVRFEVTFEVIEGGKRVSRELEDAIRRILPSKAKFAFAYPNAEVEPLLPEEFTYVSNAVPKRIAEFRAGRHCARRSLEMHGEKPLAIHQRSDRSPIWPRGYVGSISHCSHLALAATARESEVHALGIDVESASPLVSEILESILTQQEIDHCCQLPELASWDKLIFSAKESVFKAVYPTTMRWIDFHDVQIAIFSEEQRFRVKTATTDRFNFSELDGRYCFIDGLVLTAAFCVTGA